MRREVASVAAVSLVLCLAAASSPAAAAQVAARRCVPVVGEVPGFPVHLPNLGGSWFSNAVTSANVADLDGDGTREIVFGRADNTLYVLDWTGSDVPGFPVNLGGIPGWGISGEPLLYDLDNKGEREIVFAANGLAPGNTTYLFVYRHTGVPHPLWPAGGVDIGTNSMHAPVGADLEGFGRRKVLVDSSEIGVGYLMNVFNSNGSAAFGFPFQPSSPAQSSSPSVADVSPLHQGAEIFFGGEQHSMHGLDNVGDDLPGWPAPAAARRAPALGDVDGDGRLDVVVVTPDPPAEPAGVTVYDAVGATLPGWPQYDPVVPSLVNSSPSLADLDGDGRPEVIVHINEAQTPAGGAIHVWHADGTPMSGWPRPMPPVHGLGVNVTVADVDHDGRLELVAVGNGTGHASLYVFNADGSTQLGFPYALPPGSFSWASATLADPDGDGKLAIVFTWFENDLFNPALSYARLEALQIRDCAQTGAPDAAPWPQARRDPRHSGYLEP